MAEDVEIKYFLRENENIQKDAVSLEETNLENERKNMTEDDEIEHLLRENENIQKDAVSLEETNLENERKYMTEDDEIEHLLRENENILKDAVSLEETNLENERKNMTEDDEIEHLLRENENIQKDAVSLEETNLENERTNVAEYVDVEHLLRENEKILKDAIIHKKKHLENEKNIDLIMSDEVDIEYDLQSQLNYELLSRKAKLNPKFVYAPRVPQIPFEDESPYEDESEDFDDSNEDDNNFTNEILTDDDIPSFRRKPVEKLQKQIINPPQGEYVRIISQLMELCKRIQNMNDLSDAVIDTFSKELVKNLDSQRQIKSQLDALSAKSCKIKNPSFTKCSFQMFGMPYFEDSKGFTPLPNEDTKRKLKNGEITISQLPKMHFWVKPHKKLLREAIRETLIQENRDRLVREIKKMEQKVKSLSGETKKYALEEVTKSQDELKKLNSMSYLELVLKENPDREYDWLKYYASVFNGLHSAEECRQMWHIYLKPSINKHRWKEEEDLRLSDLATKMNFEDWDEIAKNLGTNRTAYQCFVHYHTQLCAHDHTHGKWTVDEDKKLIAVVNASRWGDHISWAKVAASMPNRTRIQIYNRWLYCLNPGIVKGRFTEEEDLLLLAGVEVYGVSFQELSAILKNRSPQQLKNRFERYILPKTTNSGIWSLEEDKKLLQLVGIHGERSWAEISNAMRTRTRTQVRHRYNFIQSMKKKNSSWAPEKIKRQKPGPVNPSVAKIQKKVDQARQELQEIEKRSELNAVEKKALRRKKLIELRDKVLMNKCEIKQKKELFPKNCPLSDSIITYYKNKEIRLNVIKAKSSSQLDIVAFWKDIQLLKKFFGIELELPESECEITDNQDLSTLLKVFLLNSIDVRTERSTQIQPFNDLLSISKLSTGDSLEYNPPQFDDTLEKPEWLKTTELWDSPPIDVTSLNFSEFFKCSLLYYSSGLHREIWQAKANRVNTRNQHDEEAQAHDVGPDCEQLFIPPNAVTIKGLISIDLCKERLSQDTSKNTSKKNHELKQDEEISTVKCDRQVYISHLDRFKNTVLSLFGYPKLLSTTSIHQTPSEHFSSCPTESILDSLEDSQSADLKTTLQSTAHQFKLQKQKLKETVLEQNYIRKCQIVDNKKGIRFKKKVNLDNPIRWSKKKSTTALTNTSNILSGISSEERKVNTKKELKTPNQLIKTKIENLKRKIIQPKKDETIQESKSKNDGNADMQKLEVIKFKHPKFTYKRTNKQKVSEDGPQRKLTKLSDVEGS